MKENVRHAALNAIHFFVGAGSFAVLSRLRVVPQINAIFVDGRDYQSWLEHFLSGIAGPSFMLILLLMQTWASKKFKDGNWNWPIVLCAKNWILSRSPRTLYVCLVVLAASLYIAFSGIWEYSQIVEHGFFQWGQFSMDIIGSLLAIRLLCPTGVGLSFLTDKEVSFG